MLTVHVNSKGVCECIRRHQNLVTHSFRPAFLCSLGCKNQCCGLHVIPALVLTKKLTRNSLLSPVVHSPPRIHSERSKFIFQGKKPDSLSHADRSWYYTAPFVPQHVKLIYGKVLCLHQTTDWHMRCAHTYNKKNYLCLFLFPSAAAAFSFRVSSWRLSKSTSDGCKCTYRTADPRRKQFLTESCIKSKRHFLHTNPKVSQNILHYAYQPDTRKRDTYPILTRCGHLSGSATETWSSLMFRNWSTECKTPVNCKSFFSSTMIWARFSTNFCRNAKNSCKCARINKR